MLEAPLSFEAFRREREGCHGEREPTARDLLEFSRHYRAHGMCGVDHEPYRECMTWADVGWSEDGFRTVSPRRPLPPPRDPDLITYTATQVLTTVAAADPDVVDRAREKLAAKVEHWCNTRGYVVVTSRWASRPPDLDRSTVEMVLEADLVPRTDGEWPALHQAMAEDAADRAETAVASGAVEARLDALAASVGVWSNPRTWRP